MKINMYRIVELVIAIVLVLAVIYFVPKIVHKCDNCDGIFFGTGYQANIVSDAISAVSGNESKIICKECAVVEHAIALAAGKSVEDFRLPLFE